MLRQSVLLLLVVTVSVCAEPPMTLEEAIAVGVRNNYDIQIARNRAQASANSRGKGLAAFLPTLDITGSYSRTNNDQDIGLPPSNNESNLDNLNGEIALKWTLFDGFRMFIDRKRYNELAVLGEYQARDQIERSILVISQAYFDLVRQEQLLQVARDIRDISEKRLERERIRHELGGASSTDLLNAQVAVNSDQSTLLDRVLAVQTARRQLNILLGRDPATPLTVVPDITIPDLTFGYDELLEMAFSFNSSLKSAELNRTVAVRGVQNARSVFAPRLSAFASYGINEQTVNRTGLEYAGVDVATNTASAVVGLSLSLNLFNGQRDKIDLQNAQIEVNNQELALRDARNRLIATVQETYEALQKRLEIVAIEENNVQAARQNLDLQSRRNRLGTAGSLEFRDAQVSLQRAQTSLISARYQARLSLLELERLTGTLSID